MIEAGLPALVLFEHSHGDWPVYVECLHQHFLSDFVHSKPIWPNKRFAVKRYPDYDGKSATFWHLISDGANEAHRLPDFRRCERIKWPRPIIDEFQECPPVEGSTVWWKNKRGTEERYVLALDDFSYVLVIADRGEYVLPWTAYCVQHQNRRDKLRRECEGYWASKC